VTITNLGKKQGALFRKVKLDVSCIVPFDDERLNQKVKIGTLKNYECRS